MKLIYSFTFVIFLSLNACVGQSSQISSAEFDEKGVEINREIHLTYEQLLTEQEDLKIPKLYQVNGKLVPLSQLQFLNDDNGRLKLRDIYWKETWQDGTATEKKVFWDPQHFVDLKDNHLEEVDVEDMRGFEFSPVILKMKRHLPWEGEEFTQHFIQIPVKPGQNRNHWREGNLEYFFLPDNFKNIGNTHLPQFYKEFPDYTLPTNKVGMTSLVLADDRQNATASKGYTYTGSFQKPELPRVEYDYDGWLYESGVPSPSSATQKDIDDWLASVSEDVLLSNFRKLMMDHHGWASHVVLDWEAVREPGGAGLYKLANAFQMNKKERPNQTISLWGKGAMEISRVQIEGNNYKRELTRDLIFNGSFADWHARHGNDSPFRLNGFTIDNADIMYVGGYLNMPVNYGYVHHFLMQHMMNKKFFPDKKSLLMWWNRIEYVGGYDLGNVWFQKEDNEWVYSVEKPMVFPSSMHNAAVWAFAFCDGGEMWNEPFPLTENKEYLGGKLIRNRQGIDISGVFGPDQNETYAVQNFRNVDRWEGGKWAVSQNKDIVEAKTDWFFVPTARKDKPFTQGSETLPSASLYDRTPLAAVKLSEDGKTALALIYDAWNDPLKQNEISLKIGDKTQKVKVFGRYTSVVRIKL
jgi:hypothetical protein